MHYILSKLEKARSYIHNVGRLWMQRRSTAKSTILNATSYELKLLLRGILFPASLAFFLYML